VATIPLADFPDNFNRKDELDIAVLSYANNLGLDVQDLQPLTGRALGTGAQSQVLDEKSKGKGLAAFRQQFVHSFNTWVLPGMTTMAFAEGLAGQETSSAEYNTAVEHIFKRGCGWNYHRADGIAGWSMSVYPKEFLAIDQTLDNSLADTEKPERRG
jgi:hypothetical protein